MKRVLPLFLALVSSLLLVASGCSTVGGGDQVERISNPVLSRIMSTGVLRVGMSGSQPPFNAKTRSGEIIGIEADLANALAGAMGVKAELVQKPFGMLIGALEAGEVDIVMSQMTMTPERNTRVAFAGPYFVSGKALLTKSEPLARADEPEDLDQASLRLAALKGSTSERFVEEAIPSARVVATSDYDEAVKLVIEDQVDGMIADLPICLISVLRNPDAGLVSVANPFTFEPLGVALSAEDPLFLNLVQNFMDMLEGTGLMVELQAAWFRDGSWLAELP